MSAPEPDSDPSVHWAPPTVSELRSLLPHYAVSRILGRGGMGAVYLGRQEQLDRDVAIKILLEQSRADSEDLDFSGRFRQEARAMARLDHPAIVPVYDFGTTSAGHTYYVMEYVDGMDIHSYLGEHGGRLPQDHALAIAAHVLDALEYGHQQGIVHRDIKPANILLNRSGRVKLADFGLATFSNKEHPSAARVVTSEGVAFGTPDYVAPEVLQRGSKPDHRVDLYSIGVMLYQMLTGTVPRGQFKKASALVPGLDPRLDAVISRALQPDPADRYPTAIAMRHDLNAILHKPVARLQAGPGRSVPPPPHPNRPQGRPIAPKPHQRRSHAWPVTLCILGTLAMVGALALHQLRLGRSPASSVPVAIDTRTTATTTPMPPAEPDQSVPPPKPTIEELFPLVPDKPSPPVSVPIHEPITIAPAPPAYLQIPGVRQRIQGFLTEREKSVRELAGRYANGLQSRLKQAATEGNLSLASALKNEHTRILSLNLTSPDINSVTLPPPRIPFQIEEPPPAELSSLRRTWSIELTTLLDKLDADLSLSLKALEIQLTQAQDFSSAQVVATARARLPSLAPTTSTPRATLSTVVSTPSRTQFIQPTKLLNAAPGRTRDIHEDRIIIESNESRARLYVDFSHPDFGSRLRPVTSAALIMQVLPRSRDEFAATAARINVHEHGKIIGFKHGAGFNEYIRIPLELDTFQISHPVRLEITCGQDAVLLHKGPSGPRLEVVFGK